MPFEEALEVIGRLRERIAKYADDFRRSEAQTRYSLIDPFLRLMGWDTEDPSVMRVEFPTGVGRPDYALMRDGKPIGFVGAKALGRQEDLNQYISYCVQEGIRYLIVTDGSKWEVHDAFLEKPLPEKRLVEWDIASDEPAEILRRAFAIIHGARRMEDAPINVFKPPSSQSAGTPLDKIKVKMGDRLGYSIMVFPDGKQYSVKSWRQLLVNSVEWLIETGKLTAQRCPVSVKPGKRYAVHTEPKHASGRKFRDPRKIRNLYVETGLNSVRVVRWTKLLLNQFGINLKEIRLA
ncbi:MAG: hypothetical protein QXH35_05390 [Nitrososphaerota archaeon]